MLRHTLRGAALALAPLAAGGLACGGAPAVIAPPPVASSPERPVPAARPGSPPPDPTTELAAKIDPLFSDFWQKGKTPGCAVGVYRAGEVVFSKGYGYADLEHDAPITDATPFYTASLSKQFTAAAVVLLAADGKLSLNDDVRRFIPELHDVGARITLDHLLHHTSGLRDYHLLLMLAGVDEEDVVTRREVLWLVSHQRSLSFPPGSHLSYSSSGYVLLAEVVARVSGEPFSSFLARRVLAPLGMTSSLVRDDHARLIPGRAIGYTLGSDGAPRMLMGNLEYPGSSTLVTTTRDLARWDASFYAPAPLGLPFVDAMRTQGKLTDGTPLEYAMGLVETVSHGRHVEVHDGAFAGYRSVMMRFPDERLAVSVLCNTTEADAYALGEKVSTLFVPEAPTTGAGAPVPTPFGFDLAEVTGAYVDPSTADTRTVERSDGGLRLVYGGAATKPRELVPVGRGDFAVRGGPTHYAYEPAKGKHPAQLTRVSRGGEPARTFVRMPLIDTAASLAEYTGRYGSLELPHDLEIRIEGGRLVAGPVGGATRTAPFAAVAHDIFRSPEVHSLISGDVGWRFERDARGKVTRVVASDDRAPEVVLDRR